MNRKEESLNSVSSVRVGKSRMSRAKKFVSRSEELCDWMASLGYQLPRNAHPEHFEYIFQSEDTARIIKQMMKVVKQENILDPVEMAKFDQMKNEGGLLYGKELEVHFDRIKAMKIERAKKEAATIEKDRKLDQMIADKERELSQWKAVDASLAEQLDSAEHETIIARNKAEFEKVESEKLDQEIQMMQQELIQLSNDLLEYLRSIHLQLSSTGKNKATARLCGNDNTWLRMLENEEKLSSTIKSLYDKFGDEQEFGAGDGLFNPQFTQITYKMFKQQEDHLERLRHELMHEKLREVEMDIEMAGIKKVTQSIGDIMVEAKLLNQAEPAIRERMIQDLKESSDTFDTILRREERVLKDSTKQDVASRLESQIKEIVDLKSCAKKKKQDLMCFLVNMLVSQRVRVDVIRELFRAEKLKNEKFIWYLQEYRNSMFDFAKREDELQKEINGIPSVDTELAAALEKYSIEIAPNPVRPYQYLGLLKSLEESEKFHRLTEGQQVSQICYKVDNLHSLVKKLKTKTHEESAFQDSISNLESMHNEMERNLRLHEINKESRAKENNAKVMNQIKEVTDFLSQLKVSSNEDIPEK